MLMGEQGNRKTNPGFPIALLRSGGQPCSTNSPPSLNRYESVTRSDIFKWVSVCREPGYLCRSPHVLRVMQDVTAGSVTAGASAQFTPAKFYERSKAGTS